MEKNKSFAIDWPSLKSGVTLHMSDFPSIKLIKLDNKKGFYFGNDDSDGVLVDIGLYDSEVNGEYYYFQITKDDWHPITSRLWSV
jgi:hypothetical protein